MTKTFGSFGMASIDGLTDTEQSILNELLKVWQKKLTNNAKRLEYYRCKNSLKDLDISIPPMLKKTNVSIGWPAKAVNALAARSRFDGFVFAGEVAGQDKLLQQIIKDNDFKSIYNQSVRSELIHSCSFLTVSAGGKNEPPAIIGAYSAQTAAAVWDYRRRRIKYGMTIIDINPKSKKPTWVNLYTDDAVLEIHLNKQGDWQVNRVPHQHKRPLIEALVYRPDEDRPFGESRISKTVMSLTDSAVRESLRSEIAAEFFTSPQRYLLGATDKDFEIDKWELYIGSIFTAGRNENGEAPTYGQLPQGSMQPHTDYMRSLAAQFAGETSIPVAYLGVIHDNPASAEAMYTASEELIIEASDLNETNGKALTNIALLALAMALKKPLHQLTDDERSIMPKFLSPGRPSIVSQSDAMVKQASVAGWLAETNIFWEELGYTKEQITRMMSEKHGAEALERIKARMFGHVDKE